MSAPITDSIIIGRLPTGGGGGGTDYGPQILNLLNQIEELKAKTVQVGEDGKIDDDVLPVNITNPITSVNNKKEGDIILTVDDIEETVGKKYFTEDRVRGLKLSNYVKPSSSRAITQNDTLEVAVGLNEAGVTESKTLAQTANDLAAAASTASATALSTANTANSAAGTATSTANTALSTANTANSLATTANTTAGQALALAQNAVPVVGGVIPVQYFGGLLDKEIVDYPTFANFPATGNATTIYVDKSDNNKKYDWTGTTYVATGGGGTGSVTINGKTGSVINLTPADLNLDQVPNVDTRNPVNINQTASYRFATDTEKSFWNAKQAALGFTPIPNTRKINNKVLTDDVLLTKADFSDLNLVANVDSRNPVNISQTSAYRFVSDTEKTTWNAKQNALGFTPVPNTLTINGQALSQNRTLTKANFPDLNKVDNTTDLEKTTIETNPVKLKFDTKADAESAPWVPLTLVTGTTNFTHVPLQPNREIVNTVVTTLSPQMPVGGWQELHRGLVLLTHNGSGNIINFAGTPPTNYPSTPDKMDDGDIWVFAYNYIKGALSWTAQYIRDLTSGLRLFAQGDGVDNHISIPETANNSDEGNMTYEAWVKYGSSPTGQVEIIIEKGTGSLGTVLLSVSSSGYLRVGVGSSRYIESEDPLNDNLWHHVMWTMEPGIGTLKVYLDGALMVGGTMTGIAAYTYNDSPYALLSRPSSTGMFAYGGRLGTFRIFKNRIFSALEVADLYEKGQFTRTALAGEYLWNGNANDTSGFSNHGVPSRGTAFGLEGA